MEEHSVGYAEAAGYQSIGDDIPNSTIILFLENSHKPAIGRGGGYFVKISTNSPAVPVSGQSSDFTITAATQRPGTMSIRTTPEMGALLWINDMGAGTTDSTFLNMPPLTYPVKVALSGYYPVGPTNVKVNQGLPATRSFPLIKVETADNALLGLRHIVVDSVPDGARVFIMVLTSGWSPGW